MIRFTIFVLLIWFLRIYFAESAVPQNSQNNTRIVTRWILPFLDATDNSTGDLSLNENDDESLEESENKFFKLFFGNIGINILEEFYCMSVGEEIYHLSGQNAINENYYAIANATVNLWLQLHILDRVEPIIKSSVLKAKQFFEDKRTTHGMMDVFFANVKQSMEADLTLHHEYLRIKNEWQNDDSKIVNYKLIETDEEVQNIDKNPIIVKILTYTSIHRYCFRKSNKIRSNKMGNYILARSIVQLSKLSQKRNIIQHLYEETRKEIFQKYSTSDETTNTSMNNVCSKLLKKLIKKIKKNAKLNSDLKVLKKNILSTIS